MSNNIRIGVDTGGTFTDFVIFADGRIVIKKLPSTPPDPSLAILGGLKDFLIKDTAAVVIHGTTVATNSLLERRGGPIALITTAGFEDVLFIGRQVRKNLYSLIGETRRPLLPRRHCYGIEERTTALGQVEKSPSIEAISEVLDKIEKNRIQAVAVSLINSYANPSNERVIQRALSRRKLLASVSSNLLPEYREYERTTVTAVNAYLMPVMSRYLAGLGRKLGSAELRIMQSNEGFITPATAKKVPIRTALSGPAGGVVAGYLLGKSAGFRNIITFDMGGTSSDVSLIDGQIRRTNESMIGDFPVRLSMIDIHTVGAGGGSIADVDKGGSLRVGPQSAGADPGPACYGKGRLPTVTDANLVLGRLVPEFFLGGKMRIDLERSLEVLSTLARKIGKSLIETAEGIIAIANANMEKAIRVISIERGFDPRNFALFSFGGAGGMHAADIAAHLRMPFVIIPKNAGVLSALGLLLADSVKDFSLSVLEKTEKMTEKRLTQQLDKLQKNGFRDIHKEGFQDQEIRILPYVDMRYFGQSYEITIPYHGFKHIAADFHKAHQELYAYHHPDQPTEIVNIRVKAVGLTKKIRLKKYSPGKKNLKQALFKSQPLYYEGEALKAQVFDRSTLLPGHRIKGPALVVDPESTAFVPPGFVCQGDSYLNLIIRR